MLGASSIGLVLGVYRPEREALVGLLSGLGAEDWRRATECPSYTVKGIATHVLGDDLSLLSRQRDNAEDGVSILGREVGGSDFRVLLDAFNDRWEAAARFLSPELLVELLQLCGEWTATYYESVDPEAHGEPVGLFGADRSSTSPFWHAIAREYLERWTHHSQIRRALGLGTLADRRFLAPGVEVAAAIAHLEPGTPGDPDGPWTLGPLTLGTAQQAADVLTRAHSEAVLRELVEGPADLVALFAAVAGRP